MVKIPRESVTAHPSRLIIALNIILGVAMLAFGAFGIVPLWVGFVYFAFLVGWLVHLRGELLYEEQVRRRVLADELDKSDDES